MDFAKEWDKVDVATRRKILKKLIEKGNVRDVLPLIQLVKAPGNWGVYASTGQRFSCAIFGRDSLIVAEDLMEIDGELVHEILHALARLQGTEYNAIREEEPGKIHHEYRSKKFANTTAHKHSLAILAKLQKIWGGEGTDQMIYYGSYDATPLYIRTFGSYVLRYGHAILDEEYLGRDGKIHTMRYSLQVAIDWLVKKLEESKWTLLEYKRTNPKGIANQAWKDSQTAYLHPDGSLPNHKRGIASVELQGYAYDALQTAIKLTAQNDQQAKDWQQLAKQLQTNTLRRLWMPKQAFFAQGLEHSTSNRSRQIATLTSNSSVLLDSSLLQDLPENERTKYLKAVTALTLSSEFLTPAGIRCRALKHADIPGFIDYHGTHTVWPKETNSFIKGLRRQRLHHLAEALSEYIFKSVIYGGDLSEFFYVEKNNNVWYDRKLANDYFADKVVSDPLHLKKSLEPEAVQAWTVSAIIKLIYDQTQTNAEAPIHTWEESMLSQLPSTASLMEFV